MQADQANLERVLGAAVVRLWGRLPRDIQESLFEQAVAAGHDAEHLREHLAVFLHDRHPRTDHPRAS
jgi:hypothetical protein